MKKYLSLITLLFTIFIFSQNDENDNTPVNLKDAKIGYIIDLNNQRKEVYVRLLGNDNKPWVNQRAVRVAEIDKVDPKTNKVDFDRMSNDEILGYGVDGRNFRLIEYVNVRAATTSAKSDSNIFDDLNSVKNLTKQKHLAEILVDGKYKVYKLYGYPKIMDVTTSDEERRENDDQLELLRTSPTLIVQKDNDKFEVIKLENFEKIAKDCKVVSKKLENGDYDSLGYEKPKKSSLMGKMIKMAQNQYNGNVAKESLIITFFNDLNENCK